MQPDSFIHPAYQQIILIDDDAVQNHVNKIVIRQYLRPYHANIISFTDPLRGLGYVKEINTGDSGQALLLVDINMPVLSGWRLLQNLSQLDKAVLQHLTIYMLSSSIDPADKVRAAGNPLIKDCISKPLSEHLKEIFGEPVQSQPRSN